MNSWADFFRSALTDIDAQDARRHRRESDDGLINFGSNDYLSLSQHSKVCAASHLSDFASQPANTLAPRFGSGASPVLGGYSTWHQRLDQSLASLCSAPAAITFGSGYACNIGVIAALAGQGDLILSDQLNHASLIDGCRLSRATTIVYPHLNVDAVEAELSRRDRYSKCLIVTESVFSMDGDQAPLTKLVNLASQYDAALVVDEAHATGVYGLHGAGLLEEYGIINHASREAWPVNLIKLGTLSKAIGCMGGFACASSDCIDFLVNRCRSFLFSTSMPPQAAAAATTAVELVPTLKAARQHLSDISEYLRRAITEQGWAMPQGKGPIVPILVGDSKSALALSERLKRGGFQVPAIRPPTVPHGTSRLRISLTAKHTHSQIADFLQQLGKPLPA